MIRLRNCPTCGSTKLKKVKRSLTREFEGRTFTVPNVEFLECPECGENVYDRDAMRKIEAHSPAFARTPAGR